MTKVLIVEDREMQKGFLRELVNGMEGLACHVVDSLDEVGDICTGQDFPYGCALVDMEIYQHGEGERGPSEKPHLDWGFEALVLIGKKLVKDDILVFTIFAPAIRDKLQAMGYRDRMRPKPIHSSKLRKEISRMVQKRQQREA